MADPKPQTTVTKSVDQPQSPIGHSPPPSHPARTIDTHDTHDPSHPKGEKPRDGLPLHPSDGMTGKRGAVPPTPGELAAREAAAKS